jgi:hypothetical protein
MVTFFLSLLALAICLFLTILITVIAGKLHGVPPDLRFAYRHYALPIAAVSGGVILILSTVMEIRYFRQSKALAAIARSSQS